MNTTHRRSSAVALGLEALGRSFASPFRASLAIALMSALSACSADGASGNEGGGAAAPGAGNTPGGGGDWTGTGSVPGGGVPNGGTGSGFNPTTGGAGGVGGGTGGVTGPEECVDQEPPPPEPPMPESLDQCPGPLDAATVNALKAGGPVGSARMLYPYDGTVFPLGLSGPLLQWENDGNADAVYIHMKSSLYEYWGCFGADADKALEIPADAWAMAGRKGQGGSDPLTLEVTIKSGSNIIGPLTTTLRIAQGKLKGTLYYNTYTSPQAGANGAVMRLRMGASQPDVLLTDVGVTPVGPCWSCHSLSAHGNMLVAQRHAYPNISYESASFDLAANPNPSPPSVTRMDGRLYPEMGLGAVYPDGSKVLTMGSPGDSSGLLLFPEAPGNVPGMIGPKVSKLLNTRTGAELPVSGWTVQYAQMPSFSSDGTMVVFNWYEDSQGHTLAVADFDSATNTFSNVRKIYKHATLFPGWPWITPDNKEVIFVLGNAADYVSSYPGRIPLASSDLWTVDIESGAARELARANGYPQAGGTTYLPRPGRDEHLVYFPTISPIQAGGYFWVFFTSRRTYGNQILQVGDDAITKKIWVSAYAIRPDGAAPITDPSYPPFYLPGQEMAAGNIRAFAALDPCHQDGDACETGVDCCGGLCSNGVCGPPPPPPPICMTPPPPPCSNIDERCTTEADCCNPEHECIAGFCSPVEPIE